MVHLKIRFDYVKRNVRIHKQDYGLLIDYFPYFLVAPCQETEEKKSRNVERKRRMDREEGTSQKKM